ncbi:MAG TPA: squalene/phytoene synthase family protein [Myxococcales bacterium]|nr:squalene/phytoene synthase family protein [Myxococcales bacterium]
MTEEGDVQDASFYQRHLDAVSRSFALCIPQLEEPFRDRVALAYLLFRVLDTVEDAPFADRERQQRLFDEFRALLRERPANGRAGQLAHAFPAGLTAAEAELLRVCDLLFADAWELPEEARGILLGALDRMAQGMAAYARRGQLLRLVDVEDVSRYCCFVAGVVGEMLTRLWALDGGRPPSMLAAYRFGLYLQKVNILKDQREDEAAGRFLVPDRAALLASLRADARGALEYVTTLPRDATGYRIFCSWSLMLGATSLSQLGAPAQSRRAETLALLGRTAEIASDDEALSRLFRELLPPLPDLRPERPLRKPEPTAWFVRALGAPLSPAELSDLGAVVQ